MDGSDHLDDMVFGRRYRVTERLGAGGMADVYKAVDETLGRTVAVKVLRSRFADDPAFVERFRREAQSAANLSHPGIVNIYDWGNDGGTYYIVMEYVGGTDLKSLVRQKGSLDPLRVAEYGEQVCAALSVAHGYDIIHRDIKPQNIVLMPDGRVRVMDFGIARMTDGDDLTQTGSVLGTAQYVSPEQAQGKRLTVASDLYSLGVVLYELLCGRPPFEGDTPVAVALKQVHDEPAPPRRLEPSIPAALESVVLRALAKDPRQRYESADEMRRDLRRVLDGRAPAAAEHSMGDTTVMPRVESTPRSAPMRAARPAPRKPRVWPWIAAVAALALIGIGGAWTLGVLGPPAVVVPDLAGLTVEEATSMLQGVGLAVGETTEEYSEEASGTIIGQDPKGGARAAKGETVNLVASKGAEMVLVPTVAGMIENDAYNALKSAGFDLQPVQRIYDPEIAEGYAIDTTPTAGTMLPKGAPITLIVSEGIETKAIPDVVGKTSAEAKTALEKAGFKVNIREEFSDTVAKGKVMAQDPDSGVVVQTGSTVRLTVSKGKNETTVPDVTDKTEAEARTLLSNAGLEVLKNETPAADPGDVGVVLNQSPTAGRKVPLGTTVTIWVGVAP